MPWLPDNGMVRDMMEQFTTLRSGWVLAISLLLLSGCESWNKLGSSASKDPSTARYPVDPDIAKVTRNPYRTLKDDRGALLGDLHAGFALPGLFGADEPATEPASTGIPDDQAANIHLWRAALDSMTFMPIDVADVKGGVIQTDWYEDRDRPHERFKVHVFVISNDLRIDGVKVGVFRQTRSGNQHVWQDAKSAPARAETLRMLIFNRARDLQGLEQG